MEKKIADEFTILEDNMCSEFPSIWLANNKNGNSIAICGFYREWSHNGENSEASQINRMKTFVSQIERASPK